MSTWVTSLMMSQTTTLSRCLGGLGWSKMYKCTERVWILLAIFVSSGSINAACALLIIPHNVHAGKFGFVTFIEHASAVHAIVAVNQIKRYAHTVLKCAWGRIKPGHTSTPASKGACDHVRPVLLGLQQYALPLFAPSCNTQPCDWLQYPSLDALSSVGRAQQAMITGHGSQHV